MRDIEDTCTVLSVCSEGLTALHMVGCRSNLADQMYVCVFVFCASVFIPTQYQMFRQVPFELLLTFKDLAVRYITIKLLESIVHHIIRPLRPALLTCCFLVENSTQTAPPTLTRKREMDPS